MNNEQIVNTIKSICKEHDITITKLEETLGIKLQSETNAAIGIVSGVHTGPHPIGLGCVQKYETL